jgi:hypothetical protein
MKLFIAVLAVLVAVALSAPAGVRVQKDLHEIARTVKSSSKYDLEEKREILAKLKLMNNEAKEYIHADSKAEKHELAATLKRNYQQLKHSMHEESSKGHSYEEEDAKAEVVRRVVDDVQASKAEVYAKAVSENDKMEARSLTNQLEEQSNELRDATRHERKAIAKQMQETVAKLRSFEERMTQKVAKQQKVFSDIDNIESGLTARHMSLAEETVAKDELEGIRREVASSHPNKEAINARMTMLKSKLRDEEEENELEEREDVDEEAYEAPHHARYLEEEDDDDFKVAHKKSHHYEDDDE